MKPEDVIVAPIDVACPVTSCLASPSRPCGYGDSSETQGWEWFHRARAEYAAECTAERIRKAEAQVKDLYPFCDVCDAPATHNTETGYVCFEHYTPPGKAIDRSEPIMAEDATAAAPEHDTPPPVHFLGPGAYDLTDYQDGDLFVAVFTRAAVEQMAQGFLPAGARDAAREQLTNGEEKSKRDEWVDEAVERVMRAAAEPTQQRAAVRVALNRLYDLAVEE